MIGYLGSLALAMVALAGRAPKSVARDPAPTRPDSRVIYLGSARPRGKPIASLVDGSPVLVEAIEVSRWWSSQRIHSTRSADLWLECKNGDRVVIGGDLQVLLDRAPRRRIDHDDPILDRLNVPVKQRFSVAIAVVTIRPGDDIRARGEPLEEHAPELDSYRQTGDVMALRGRPEAPVEVHVVPPAGNSSPIRRIVAWWRRATTRVAGSSLRRLSRTPRSR